MKLLKPLSIFNPEFGEDNIGLATSQMEMDHLLSLDRGTVITPKLPDFNFVPIFRQTRLEIIQSENPEETFQAKERYYLETIPKVNQKRLEFIKEQQGYYYNELGVHPLACLGEEGMGYEWDEQNNKWQEFPQRGGIEIGVNVRIGAFTSIKKATMDGKFTRIGDGCKIGSHCNIGHNVQLGKNCLLTHRVSIAGSCEIGDRVTFWQGCMIAQKVKIGDGAVIGMGAVVLNDVPAGSTVYGNPAIIK